MTAVEVMQKLSYLSPITLVIGCALGAARYVKSSATGKLIFWYLASMLCIDVVARYWADSASYNLFMLSVAGLTDLFFFSWLYVRHFRVSFRKVLLTTSALTAVAIIVATVLYDTHKMIAEFQSYDKVACDSVIFLYAVVSMFDLLKGKGELQREIVRINLAVLLYFSLDMLISLTINFLVNAGVNFVIFFWLLRLTLLLTLYIILIYTLWQTGKNPKRWQYG